MSDTKKISLYHKIEIWFLSKKDEPSWWKWAFVEIDSKHAHVEALYAAQWALSCDGKGMDPNNNLFEQAVQYAISSQHALSGEHAKLKDDLAALLEKHNHIDFWKQAYKQTKGKAHHELKAVYAARWALACDHAKIDPSGRNFPEAIIEAITWQHHLPHRDADLKNKGDAYLKFKLAAILEKHDELKLWKAACNATQAKDNPALKAFYAARWLMACDKAGFDPADEEFGNESGKALSLAIAWQNHLPPEHKGLKNEITTILEKHDNPNLWQIAFRNTSDEEDFELRALYAARWALSFFKAKRNPDDDKLFKNVVAYATQRLPYLPEGEKSRNVATHLIRAIKSCNKIGICQAARNGAARIIGEPKGKEALLNLFAANLFFTEANKPPFPATLATASSIEELTAPVSFSPPTRREIWKQMRAARPAAPGK